MKSKNKYLRFKRVVDGWIPFSAILVIFAISAGLIAVNSAFPLPYDERYHFALIEHYSHQLSPIITAQPAELAIVGDATRLGSYLSHYLLSLPLRFTAMFTSDVQMQITALRLINVGFVLAALVLLRIFVARLTKSGVAANLAVAVLALLPVTSLLAAHINYDNLMLLVFAGLLVSGQSIAMRIKTGGQLPVSLVSIFTATALLGCLVKFTFLPIAVVFLAVFGVSFIRAKAWRQVTVKRTAISRVVAVGSLILVAVSAGLFAERYVGNTLVYGTPQPDCDAVQ